MVALFYVGVAAVALVVERRDDEDYAPLVVQVSSSAAARGHTVEPLPQEVADAWFDGVGPTWATAVSSVGLGNQRLGAVFDRLSRVRAERLGPEAVVPAPEGRHCLYWPVVPRPGAAAATAEHLVRVCFQEQVPDARPASMTQVAVRFG